MVKLLFSSILFLSIYNNNVNAEFYDCQFTEPFFNIYISTKFKVATIHHFDARYSRGEVITETQKSGFKRIFKLKNGETLEIKRNIQGNNGMADIEFPFEIKYKKYFGGCDGESQINKRIVIERWADWRNSYGTSFVNYWPGEYGHTMGYQAKKKIRLAEETTWQNLKNAVKSKKTCTIPARKKYAPNIARRFEKYAFLSPVKLSKENNNEFIISYLSEGYCLLENNGAYKEKFCPEEVATPQVQDFDADFELPDFGQYLYLQCEEGHFTWVGHKTLENDSYFKVLGPTF